MADFLLNDIFSYLTQEDAEPLLLESSLPVMDNNYKNITAGDGMSVGEQIK